MPSGDSLWQKRRTRLELSVRNWTHWDSFLEYLHRLIPYRIRIDISLVFAILRRFRIMRAEDILSILNRILAALSGCHTNYSSHPIGSGSVPWGWCDHTTDRFQARARLRPRMREVVPPGANRTKSSRVEPSVCLRPCITEPETNSEKIDDPPASRTRGDQWLESVKCYGGIRAR